MNIPAWSWCSLFGTRALMRIVRPGSATTGSTNTTSPEKFFPGSAATWKLTSWPRRSWSAYRSGTSKDAYCGLTDCSVMSGVCGDTYVPMLTRRRPTTPPNGARTTVRSSLVFSRS